MPPSGYCNNMKIDIGRITYLEVVMVAADSEEEVKEAAEMEEAGREVEDSGEEDLQRRSVSLVQRESNESTTNMDIIPY